MSLEAKHIQAPELYGNCWINSRPVSIKDLQGKVGLIDFWDYSNYQCIKALPYISELRKNLSLFVRHQHRSRHNRPLEDVK